MQPKLIWFFLGFGLLFIFLLALNAFPKSRTFILEKTYDLQHRNPPLSEKAKIDSLLGTFEQIKYKQLDKDYLKETNSDEAKFERLLRRKKYYVIHQEDLFKKVVGNFRVHHFVTKDAYYNTLLWDKKASYYWLIDKKLLYAIRDLQEALEKENYDPEAFWIRYGHRHPKKNKAVGGAGSSRHILGEAADLVIQDIDKNGKTRCC